MNSRVTGWEAQFLPYVEGSSLFNLFSPLGRLAGRAIYFADVFSVFFIFLRLTF